MEWLGVGVYVDCRCGRTDLGFGLRGKEGGEVGMGTTNGLRRTTLVSVEHGGSEEGTGATDGSVVEGDPTFLGANRLTRLGDKLQGLEGLTTRTQGHESTGLR